HCPCCPRPPRQLRRSASRPVICPSSPSPRSDTRPHQRSAPSHPPLRRPGAWFARCVLRKERAHLPEPHLGARAHAARREQKDRKSLAVFLVMDLGTRALQHSHGEFLLLLLL